MIKQTFKQTFMYSLYTPHSIYFSMAIGLSLHVHTMCMHLLPLLASGHAPWFADYLVASHPLARVNVVSRNSRTQASRQCF